MGKGLYLHAEHSFGPYYQKDSELLILGSFPSVISRKQAFYYANPQNRFWKVLAALWNESEPGTMPDKQSFLLRHKIALYDVIQSCDIVGSSDSSIQNVVPADLDPILKNSCISRVFTNGSKASMLYQHYLLRTTGLSAVRLPSTSSANASYSLERLIDVWGRALMPEGRKNEKEGAGNH